MGIYVHQIKIDNVKQWEDYVKKRNDTTFVDTIEWQNVIKDIYGLDNYWYIAEEHGNVRGIMGLTLSNHPIFGKYLATAPFANQGGFYTESYEAFLSLLKKAKELQHKVNARYTVIRQLQQEITPPNDWEEDKIYATFHLPLRSDPQDLLLEHLRAKDRSQIKKSLRNNLSVEFGNIELLDHFWYVISRAMRELGSPYHSKNYLELLLRTFGPLSEIVIIYDQKMNPCGAALLMYHKKSVVLLHANILKNYRSEGAGDFLYWSVIDKCCRRNFKILDMGRSLIGSGNEKYKLKFRPDRKVLSYLYNLSQIDQIPKLNQANPKFNAAIKTWSHLPLWMTRFIGPKLISGIL